MTPLEQRARELVSEDALADLLYEIDPMCGHDDCRSTAKKLWPVIMSALSDDGWRPIEEAGDCEDGFLVCDASKPNPAVGTARLIDGVWRGYDHSMGVECIWPTPTHFRPLPAPPVVGER